MARHATARHQPSSRMRAIFTVLWHTLRGRTRALAVVSATIALAAAAAASVEPARQRLAESEWIRIREVKVTGHSYLMQDEVLAAVGDLVGTNPLQLDPDSLATAVATHPRIRAARVHRGLAGTLRVDVEERVAQALVVRDGRAVEVDDAGEPIPPAPGRVVRDLVLLTGAGAGGPEGVIAGLGLLAALREESATLEHRFSEIDVSEPGALVGYTNDSLTRVEFGSDGLDQQASRLAIVLSRADRDPAPPQRIDLRFEHRVFVTPGEWDASRPNGKGVTSGP